MFRVFGHYVSASTLALGIAETISVGAALCVGSAVLAGGQAYSLLEMGVPAALMSVAVVIVMHSSGLYDTETLSDIRHSFVRLAFIAGPIFLLAVVTTGALAKHDVVKIYPYRWQWTIALAAVWFAGVLLCRMIFARLQERGVTARRVVALGDGRLVARVRELAKATQGSVRVAGQIPLPECPQACDETSARNLWIQMQRVRAKEIVVEPQTIADLPVSNLFQCRMSGLKIVGFPEFYERESGRVDISAVGPGWLLFSQGFRKGQVFEFIKRAMDIGISLVGIVVVAPVMIVTAALIMMESPGTILYRQERVGRLGKPFMILKFRSMRMDAESGGAPVWASESDPRVTRIGRLIRKVRIDELPQFFNVLCGDMSFIGPRPERPYFVADLATKLPYYQQRHVVRPGITGWAQVNFHYGASLEDAAQKHSYDLYYLKHRSLFLDVIILLKTVRVILFAKGGW